MINASYSMMESRDGVQAAVESFCSRVSDGLTLHTAISEMHKLCEASDFALSNGMPSAVLAEILKPAYKVHALSPFIERLQTWPRGYPGDFETIEWIASSQPRLDQTHQCYWLEWYTLNCSIAQQHRNKLVWQRGLMEAAASKGGRILNIGCGGCADLANSPNFISECKLVLLDIDSDALKLAASRVKAAHSVTIIQRDIVRGVREALSHGPFDLIICGGLFDYLPDRLIQRLLSLLSGSVSDDGVLCFTNISNENPFRVWIENLANWNLIHRDAEKIISLTNLIDKDKLYLKFIRDPSNLTWLCSISSREKG